MSEVVRHRERFPQLIARRCRPLDAIEATNTLPPCWTDPGACEREQVCRKYLGPKNPEGKTHAHQAGPLSGEVDIPNKAFSI